KLGREPFEVLVTEVVRHAGGLLPLRVEGEELTGELADRLACTVLEVVPGFPSELGQCGNGVVGPDVARDFPELLVRHVEPVVAAEAEEEVVARDPGHFLRLETEELPDAVILVDDEVSRPEIGERLQRPSADPSLARRSLAEDLRVREQDEPEIAPDEASPRRRDREEQLGLAREAFARFDDS